MVGACGDPSVDDDGTILVSCGRGSATVAVRHDPRNGRSVDMVSDPSVNDLVLLPNGEVVVSRLGRERGVYRCGRQFESCRRIYPHEAQRPSASPDGRLIAVLVQEAKGTVVRVLPADGGAWRDVANGSTFCRPAWSSPSTLWVSQRLRGALTWTEIDLDSGRPTGKSQPGQNDCMWGTPDPARPVRGRAWRVVEDESEVRLVTISMRE
jgi:hypothetical protein